jgi:SET domain-containing protein
LTRFPLQLRFKEVERSIKFDKQQQMVDDRPFPSASPTNNANSSSPSNSDFEQISASSSINSMNSGGNSGGSSGVGVTATNVNAAMNNENNGSAEQGLSLIEF